MNKITLQQVTLIDAALKKTGIAYIDVRYEMTDHVATTLEYMEGDFDVNFEQYMQLHKKELEATNYRFVRAAKIKSLKMMLYTMLSLKTLAAMAGIFCIMQLLNNYNTVPDTVSIIQIVNAVLTVIPLGYFIYTNALNTNKRFSGSDKLLNAMAGFAFIFIFPFKMQGIFSNPLFFQLYYTVASGFSMAFLTVFLQLNKQYKLRYEE